MNVNALIRGNILYTVLLSLQYFCDKLEKTQGQTPFFPELPLISVYINSMTAIILQGWLLN